MPSAKPDAMKTSTMNRPHIADWLDDYAAGSLESRIATEIEAHLLVCDVCFAAYLAHTLHEADDDAGDPAEPPPA